MSTLQNLLDKINNLLKNIHNGVHAPHKPLLILHALGELSRGNESVSFRDVESPLTRLLKDFGPQRVTHHPEYPFWYLQNDGLWVVTSDGPLERRKSNNDPKKTELIKKNAVGSFSPVEKKVLMSNPENVRIVARTLLDANFPESLHQDILDSVGLSVGLSGRLSMEIPDGKKKRSSDFRRRVLRAYESRCCLCGYDIRLGDRLVGVEAAHIMWHQVGGPDEESNGLALCVLHHKVFDFGAFTIDVDGQTVVCSQELSGTTQTEWLLGFHGSRLTRPQSEVYFPKSKYFDWHRKTIFKGPGRDIAGVVW